MNELNESKGFGLKAGIMNIISLDRSFDGLQKKLLKFVSMCKDADDINYLRKDIGLGIKTLKKRMEKTDNKDEKKEIKQHIDFLQNEYRDALNKKAKELKSKLVVESVCDIILEKSINYMPSDSPHFETMEHAIDEIQDGKNINQNLKKIKIALAKEFKVNCEEIYIVNNNLDNYFFGASIIPTEEECYKIADNIIRGDENIKFDKCSSFIIHLDSKLLYDVDATPKEIVAAILHEIGHKAFSSLSRVELKDKLIKASFEADIMPEQMKNKYIMYKTMLIVPILNTFTSSLSSISLIKEIKSDNFAVRCGYGSPLASLLNKLLEIDTSSNRRLFRRDVTNDKEQEMIVKWSVRNIINLKVRRNQIIKELESHNKDEHFQGIKNIMTKQISKIKNMKINSSSSMLLSGSKNINESLKSFIEVKTKGYSQLELDELEIEIGRIEYHEDKLYLVNRIHKDIADAERVKASLQEKFNKSGSTHTKMRIEEINSFINKLKAMPSQIKKVKIIEKDFDIYVKYPAGYEG